MKKISIKLRVTLWYVIAMIVISLFAFFAMNSVTHTIIERDLAEKIGESVNKLSMLASNSRGTPERIPDFEFYEKGVHMALYDSEKKLIKGQIAFGITDEFNFEDNILRKVIYNDTKYYEYDRLIRTRDNRQFWVKGLVSVADENYAAEAATKNNLIFMIIVVFFAAVGGYFIINRALLPVDKILTTAKEIIKSKDLSQRINIGKGNDEIHKLANTFDDMLSEIESSFEREQQFTSDASHELRTPVAVILSECEYMTDCADTVEELKESAVSVKEQAERMSKLISELLTISRMDKNTQKLNFEETPLSELINFICDEQEMIHDGTIKLERDIDENIIAKADNFLIARLFINLISNAYNYNKENGKIKVSLHEKDENIIFSVADTGIGIAEEECDKIWERFYQVDPSRNSGESGNMGLGLSMVKWIAKCHNGEITLKSKLGEGSTFIFIMPKNI